MYEQKMETEATECSTQMILSLTYFIRRVRLEH